MPQIKPFAGWRYDPGKVEYAQVTMPPYDIISPEMQNDLYKKDDRNSVRVIYGREFAEDSESDNRYTRAAAHLDAWRTEKLFLQDKPAIYVFQQEFMNGGQKCTRRGFFARVLLSDWSTDGIYPHEKTLSGPKKDRLQLMRTTRANTEPVFGLLTDPTGDISRSLYSMCQYAPVADFVDGDQTRNLFWVMDDAAQAPAFCAGCSQEQIFIADGHHRYETAINYRNEVREAIKKAGQTPPPLGELAEDYIMMYIVPDSDPGLVIWPTHRLLYGVNGLDSLVKRLGEKNFLVEKIADTNALTQKMSASNTPAYGFVYNGEQYFVALKDWEIMNRRAAAAIPEWRCLDVSVLHLLILEDLLGIDEGKLLRKENLLYTHDLQEALAMIKDGKDGVQCGFILRSTTMAQVRNISRAGSVMPQKSTYFFPKVVSGMVFNFFW